MAFGPFSIVSSLSEKGLNSYLNLCIKVVCFGFKAILMNAK